MSENTSNESERPYDPDEDPDSNPEMLQEQAPAEQDENERDPAEGADDSSATGDAESD